MEQSERDTQKKKTWLMWTHERNSLGGQTTRISRGLTKPLWFARLFFLIPQEDVVCTGLYRDSGGVNCPLGFFMVRIFLHTSCMRIRQKDQNNRIFIMATNW